MNRMCAWVTATILAATAGLSPISAEEAQFELANEFMALAWRGAGIVSWRHDPSGRRQYGPSMVRWAGFEDFKLLPETRTTNVGDEIVIAPLSAQVPQRMEVLRGSVPEMLVPGSSLGQSFTWGRGELAFVEAILPTWQTSDAAATLTLRRDGPSGEIVASRRLKQVADNSWQRLVFEPQPPGRYYLELSQPQGTIGWWSKRGRVYQAGMAYRGGKPAPDLQRGLRAGGAREAGTATVRCHLDGSRAIIRAEVQPRPRETQRAWPFTMRVRWVNEGYEVTAQTSPFFRFLTDNQRYLPAQQLKRWRERQGRYELSFTGARWVECDGLDNYDLRIHGENLRLSWTVAPRQLTMTWMSAVAPVEKGHAISFTFETRPREDAVPDEWPQFRFLPENEANDATVFFYERAFSFPPVWGGAAWHEWNALARLWQHGAHVETLRRTWSGYPITEEGYVHTWGARPGWPFPDNRRYDTRHFDTNARFILACWRYACWTGDMEFVRQQIGRLRAAMKYQWRTLHGEQGLIVTASKDVTGRAGGVGNNYWDILPFGHLDAYANIVWYASLEAMAQLEEMLAPEDAPAPSLTPQQLRSYRALVRRAFNETFWDDRAGRYIGCIDVDGNRHDYGFTFINLEAMAYGLATEEQARRIYNWMEHAVTSSGKPDTYSRWLFAPRATTIHNPGAGAKKAENAAPSWWHFGWCGTAFGDQCQDGGAILYTSFYDLMARLHYLGADNAWRRWQAILDRWRLPDHLCGGPPLFRGEHPQQIRPGATGTDIPFPESGLVPCWLLYGVLGAQPTSTGLQLHPRLPAALPWIEITNVSYHGRLLDIRADRETVSVACREPLHRFRWQSRIGESPLLFRLPE